MAFVASPLSRALSLLDDAASFHHQSPRATQPSASASDDSRLSHIVTRILCDVGADARAKPKIPAHRGGPIEEKPKRAEGGRREVVEGKIKKNCFRKFGSSETLLRALSLSSRARDAVYSA